LTWKEYSIESYLDNQIVFWKAFEAMSGKKGKAKKDADEILAIVQTRFEKEKMKKMAKKRFKSMASMVRLLKKEHIKRIKHTVDEELSTEIQDPLDWDDVQNWGKKAHPDSLHGFGWVGVPIAIVEAIRSIAEEEKQIRMKIEPVVITVNPSIVYMGLFEADRFLTCDEIEALDYWDFVAYLLRCKKAGEMGEYFRAIWCASCDNIIKWWNLNYDKECLLEGLSDWGRLFVMFKLVSCDIPV
jgi:hypothetical protein